ncbi:hypothetical protein HDA39_006276 [Kribbella italica]|uniref:Uncharacterized protein n=1 Tax=Kribbella italica TaxID=1540520 RepID=A0A7W9JCC0_9ACTN|nr:hypothetical protein [Kribbella italica]
MIKPTASDGVEWAGDSGRSGEASPQDWPVLQSSSSDPCDGNNPMTGRPCRLGYHQGYHRDDTGAEWLED